MMPALNGKGEVDGKTLDTGGRRKPPDFLEGVSVSYYDTWTLRRVLDLAHGLHIPIEELRPLIRY